MTNHSTIDGRSEVRPLRRNMTTGLQVGVATVASTIECWRMTLNPREFATAVDIAGRVLDRERKQLSSSRFAEGLDLERGGVSGQEFTSDTGRLVVIPAWVLDAPISNRAFHLYALLASHVGGDGRASPGRADIASDLGVSVDTVDRGIAELVAIGAVGVSKRTTDSGGNNTNAYTVALPSP